MTKKIPSLTNTDKREVDLKSTNMELKGLMKCLEELREKNIVALATDAHTQITSHLS